MKPMVKAQTLTMGKSVDKLLEKLLLRLVNFFINAYFLQQLIILCNLVVARK